MSDNIHHTDAALGTRLFHLVTLELRRLPFILHWIDEEGQINGISSFHPDMVPEFLESIKNATKGGERMES